VHSSSSSSVGLAWLKGILVKCGWQPTAQVLARQIFATVWGSSHLGVFGWEKLDVAISGRGKGNSVETSSIKSQSLSHLRLSLINAFNVFNQATGKKAKAAKWLRERGADQSVSQRDSSNSVKHFTYLHINWLKRKYTPDTRTQAQSFECVNMAKWQKGRKGSGLLLATYTVSVSFSCLAISLPQLRLFLFGNFWHFKCVWLFSFWSANCEVIHWLSSGSVDALTTSMHTLSRWKPVHVTSPLQLFTHPHTQTGSQSTGGNVWKRWKTFRSFPLVIRWPPFLMKSFFKTTVKLLLLIKAERK